jgi:hypothetical protein
MVEGLTMVGVFDFVALIHILLPAATLQITPNVINHIDLLPGA